MNISGIILGILLLIAIIIGIGYGAFTGYVFLSIQWASLSNDWKAILIVVSALVLFCSLLIVISIQSSIKKYGLKGNGKVLAYNDFIHWFSALKGDNAEAMQVDALKAITNQLTLWGSSGVTRQASLLYETLVNNEVDKEQLLKKAEHVYIEIRRELGMRGSSADNGIV